MPADKAVPADEAALIAELETILGREGSAEDDGDDAVRRSTAIALVEEAALDLPRSSVPLLSPPTEPAVEPASDDADAFSNLRHVPDSTRSSLAMVLDAAPRRAPRHVHRTPVRDPQPTAAPAVARPARRKRRPVLGTVAVAAVLLGGVAGAVLFLDGNGTPAADQTAGTDIPWIRAQTGMPNSLLARPAAAAEAPAAADAAPAAGEAAVAGGVLLAEKADERVPQTEAVPPLTNTDVRAVTTQPVVAETAPPTAEPAAPAAPAGVTATTWVNMRAGAGADEAVVAVVEPGTQVEVVACENWCEVVVNGQRGFIYNEYLAGLR